MTGIEPEPGDQWLGERLDAEAQAAGESSRATPEFHSGLREAFLSGELQPVRGTSAKSESRAESEARSGGHMASIEETLAGLDPLDTPRADFRAEVRGWFLEAAPISASPEADSPAASAPVPAAPKPVRRSTATRRAKPTTKRRGATGKPSRSPGLRLLPRLMVAAAAGLLVTLILRNLNGEDAPSWSVARLRGEGPVRIDGREVPLSQVGELLGVARKIETGANGLRLTWPGEFVIDLAPETDFRADTFQPTEEAMPAFDLVAGEILVRTSERYTAGQLVFQTPEVDVSITGTTLGIEAMPGYTCVCVCEGEVRVSEPSGTTHEVPGGRSMIRTSEGEIQAFGFDRVPDFHGDPLRHLHEAAPSTLFP